MSEVLRSSRFRSWAIIGTITIIIIAVTVCFIILNHPDEYQPPPVGWKRIRPPYVVMALAEQGDIIWAGGSDGVFAIEQSTGRVIEQPEGTWSEVTYVRDLCVDKEGGLWIAHRTGLTRWSDEKEVVFTSNDGLTRGYCAAVIQDSNGTIWAGTETGIAVYEKGEWHNLADKHGFGEIPITIIFEDSKGNIWFGSDSANNLGIMRYDGENWESFSVSEGMVAHNTVTGIMEDENGYLWISSGLGNRGGATHIKDSYVTILTVEDGLRGERVRSVFQDSLGRTWFGSEYEGSAILDGTEWYTITPENGLTGWEVMEMIEDSSGTLWLATENGITRIESVYAVILNN